MQYTKRAVRSQPGMTQEEALLALQDHPMFAAGTKVASIRRRGKVWVADLLVPKTAGPFPPDDSGSEEEAPAPPKEEGPPSDDDDDGGEEEAVEDALGGPPSDGGESGPPKPKGEGGKGGKGGTEEAILHTLQEILHALQGGPVDPGLGGPDDIGPGPGGPEGPPPPHGGPGGPPPGGGHGGPGFPGAPGAKLKPGEVPNKPGVTPIGSPAFASLQKQALDPGMAQAGLAAPAQEPIAPAQIEARRQATMPPAPVGPTAPGASPAGVGGGACPTCGGPMGPGGTCPNCSGGAPGVVAGRARTITASAPATMTVKDAKAQLDAEFGPHGYSVKRIVREGNRYKALLSTHR